MECSAHFPFRPFTDATPVASVPSNTESAVVQNATTRLFQAAACI